MTDRELMQQALEALDYEAECGNDDAYHPLRAALRERLAQPEMQPCAGRNCGSTNPNLHSAECFEDYEKATGMAQPEQEPFLVATIGNWGRIEWADGVFPSLGDKMYSAPRTWVGLTDEEISELIRATHNTGSFVRAIEAKLKERNT